MTQFVTKSFMEDVLDYAGLDNSALYLGYSGRFMYGATCVGVVLPATEVMRLGVALAVVAVEANELSCGEGQDMVQVVEEMVQNTRHDSMGRDAIVYFPGTSIGDAGH